MEFHGIPSKKFHGIQWNAMELFSGKLEVPWNSMEFHGTREYGKGSWVSMELWIWTKLHGIPWNLRFCGLSSMELQVLFKCYSKSSMEPPLLSKIEILKLHAY